MAVTTLNRVSAEMAPSVAGSTAPSLTSSQSLPDHNRRYSLPLSFLPPNLWSFNTSRASLVESEQAARGEHILDEATVAHRISALRQLNGATRTRHRYAKSTGARNSTFSQPVIVRTYPGPRPQSMQQEPPARKAIFNMGKAELPPVEAFSFKGIMDSIQSSVADDLDRIAEICARSRYSLSNQYEVHLPPHGGGESFVQTTGDANGPTLQAIGSDDEQPRYLGRGSRGSRRTKSMAYGTLETIMSSSKSSEEEQSKKKSAAAIADEVRGRAARKATATLEDKAPGEIKLAVAEQDDLQRPAKPTHSRSATFASLVIDNAQGSKNIIHSHLQLPGSLVSEPAQPQTSQDQDMVLGDTTTLASVVISPMASNSAQTRISPKSSASNNISVPRPSAFVTSISSWLPWNKPEELPTVVSNEGRMRSTSNAEGSLRELLKVKDGDRKGKSIEHNS